MTGNNGEGYVVNVDLSAINLEEQARLLLTLRPLWLANMLAPGGLRRVAVTRMDQNQYIIFGLVRLNLNDVLSLEPGLLNHSTRDKLFRLNQLLTTKMEEWRRLNP